MYYVNITVIHFIRSIGAPKNDEEIVRTFSRSDVFYNRDVEPLARHFEESESDGRRPSVQAMNMYRKSVSSMSSNNDFGRRLSVLSTNQNIEVEEAPSSISQPASAARFTGPKWLPNKRIIMNPKFQMFMLHGFFHYTALYLPFLFLPSQMASVGLSQYVAGRVMSIMAFGGLISRLTCGFVMDHPKIGVMKSYTASQPVVALTMLCMQFCNHEE